MTCSKSPKRNLHSSAESNTSAKRKPGGQPGHKGKTRKGFGRVDRCEMLRPLQCSTCGVSLEETTSIKVETLQVAQLVERPIEIVEYQRHHCQCSECGGNTSVPWPTSIIPGQDYGGRLQGLLGASWNIGHLPKEKQQELLWEIGSNLYWSRD